MPGHKRIKGNEETDIVAKDGANTPFPGLETFWKNKKLVHVVRYHHFVQKERSEINRYHFIQILYQFVRCIEFEVFPTLVHLKFVYSRFLLHSLWLLFS